jgi:sugar lactone lactonase YvrE
MLAASVAEAGELWRASGFTTPESVIYDAANERLIVSNTDGRPADVAGNGNLSLLSMEGRVIARSWAIGMDEPKGMAIHGDRLYVADITRIHVVDLETGKIVETVAPEGAVFLNDVTASASGEVYVTDMMSNAIYRYKDGTVELWLKDDRLDMPNGILAADDCLIVGAWGKGMKADFSTEVPGGLRAVDIATKAITQVPLAESFANIDGLVSADGAVIASDYLAGILWRCSPGKAPEKIATLSPGSADLGTDGKTLFVPIMTEGEVVALTIGAQ